MSNTSREQVLRWVQRVSDSLEARDREEAAEYQKLDTAQRWAQVAAVCRGVLDRLDDQQRRRMEQQAEADARRWGELMRTIAARIDE